MWSWKLIFNPDHLLVEEMILCKLIRSASAQFRTASVQFRSIFKKYHFFLWKFEIWKFKYHQLIFENLNWFFWKIIENFPEKSKKNIKNWGRWKMFVKNLIFFRFFVKKLDCGVMISEDSGPLRSGASRPCLVRWI